MMRIWINLETWMRGSSYYMKIYLDFALLNGKVMLILWWWLCLLAIKSSVHVAILLDVLCDLKWDLILRPLLTCVLGVNMDRKIVWSGTESKQKIKPNLVQLIKFWDHQTLPFIYPCALSPMLSIFPGEAVKLSLKNCTLESFMAVDFPQKITYIS